MKALCNIHLKNTFVYHSRTDLAPGNLAAKEKLFSFFFSLFVQIIASPAEVPLKDYGEVFLA